MVDQEAQHQKKNQVVTQAAAPVFFPARIMSVSAQEASKAPPPDDLRRYESAGSTWQSRFASVMRVDEAVGQLPQTVDNSDIAPRRPVVSLQVLWGLRALAVILLAVGAAQWVIAAQIRSKV